jgi:aminopeptidase N
MKRTRIFFSALLLSFLLNSLLCLSQYQPSASRNYDVLKYDINLDWSGITKNGDTVFPGNVTIKLLLKENTKNYINLDARYMIIQNIKLNDKTPEYVYNDSLLKINLYQNAKVGDTMTLSIEYKAKLNEYFGATGNHIDLKDGSTEPINLIFTFNEPNYARYWFPCNDLPSDKALSQITIKNLKGYRSVSNGDLISDVDDDMYNVCKWDNKYPISTYLICAHSSRLKPEIRTIKCGSGDSLQVYYYSHNNMYWSDNGSTDLDAVNNKLKNYYCYFSDKLGKYAFGNTYRMIWTPYQSGVLGMENQGSSFLGRFDSSTVIHELIHQWIGDQITCEDWKDVWINEGFTTWLTSKLIDEQGGFSKTKNDFFNSDVLDIPIYHDFEKVGIMDERLAYNKASLVVHMIATTIGYEKTLSVLRKCLENFKYQAISTEKLKDVFKAENPAYPLSWDKFFDQWILKAGYPQLTTNYEVRKLQNGKYEVVSEIKQIQNGTNWPEVFDLPLDILIEGKNITTDSYRHYMSKREEIFRDTLNNLPYTIRLDTIDLFAKVYHGSTKMSSVENVNTPTSASISPTPANSLSGVELSYYSNGDGVSTIELYDEFSRKCAVLFSGAAYMGLNKLNLALPNLSAGMYYIKIDKCDEVEFIKTLIK